MFISDKPKLFSCSYNLKPAFFEYPVGSFVLSVCSGDHSLEIFSMLIDSEVIFDQNLAEEEGKSADAFVTIAFVPFVLFYHIGNFRISFSISESHHNVTYKVSIFIFDSHTWVRNKIFPSLHPTINSNLSFFQCLCFSICEKPHSVVLPPDIFM